MDIMQSSVETILTQVKKNQKFIGIILIVLICLIAVLVIFRKHFMPKLATLNNSLSNLSGVEGLSEGMQTGKLYFFHVDWCPHCKTAKPEWEKFVAEADDSQYEFISVDCEKDTALAKEYNVTSYPTFIKDVNGEKTELNTKPSVSALNDFIK